jgi:D-xylose transport system substrate-binding protein
MFRVKSRLVLAALASVGLVGGLFATASSAKSSSTPQLSVKSFTRTFSAMAQLKPLVKKGKGSIEVILPDTVTSARYTEFDAPYLKEAFQKAGMSGSQFKIQNAQGSDATQLTDAQSAITSGATVLIVDPLTSGIGAQIESYAKSHGVAVIDYDRLTLGGSRTYYVSFNNVNVGKLLGKGLVSCIAQWKPNNATLSSPKVIVMRGDPTDNNATLFATGYEDILKPLFNAGKYTDVADPAGTWTPNTAETEFQQAFTANPTTNALLMPNDENAAPVIQYLQSQGVKPMTFPITGQDATLVGLQNIVSGYQCGTVYKPIYLEAQAAAALAIYARAHVSPPKALVNGKTADTTANVNVPSVLETPEWVTPTNMEKTVVADGFVPASQICTGSFAADCTKYHIH